MTDQVNELLLGSLSLCICFVYYCCCTFSLVFDTLLYYSCCVTGLCFGVSRRGRGGSCFFVLTSNVPSYCSYARWLRTQANLLSMNSKLTEFNVFALSTSNRISNDAPPFSVHQVCNIRFDSHPGEPGYVSAGTLLAYRVPGGSGNGFDFRRVFI